MLLALRRFLQQARDAFGVTAVVLVGRFPEAQILRRWPWAPAFERTVSGVGQLAPLAQRVPRFRGQGYRRWWEPHHCCADGPAW